MTTAIRITLETLDSKGKSTNTPVVRILDLMLYLVGRRPAQIPAAVLDIVRGMLSGQELDGVFKRDD